MSIDGSAMPGEVSAQHPVPNKEVDARGLNCPLPILRTKKALSELPSGQVLRVVATDPGTMKDFQAFCRQTGNPLLSQSQIDGLYIFDIQRK